MPPALKVRASGANGTRPPAEPLHPVLPNATENPAVMLQSSGEKGLQNVAIGSAKKKNENRKPDINHDPTNPLSCAKSRFMSTLHTTGSCNARVWVGFFVSPVLILSPIFAHAVSSPLPPQRKNRKCSKFDVISHCSCLQALLKQ